MEEAYLILIFLPRCLSQHPEDLILSFLQSFSSLSTSKLQRDLRNLPVEESLKVVWRMEMFPEWLTSLWGFCFNYTL